MLYNDPITGDLLIEVQNLKRIQEPFTKSSLNLLTKLGILSKIQGNKCGSKPELKFLINYLPLSKTCLFGKRLHIQSIFPTTIGV